MENRELVEALEKSLHEEIRKPLIQVVETLREVNSTLTSLNDHLYRLTAIELPQLRGQIQKIR